MKRFLYSVVPGAVALLGMLLGGARIGAQVEETNDVRERYTKTEHMIPMRDGIRLYTQVYIPKDPSEPYPIMLSRTPYSVGNYGADEFRSSLGPSVEFAEEGFIFAYQDVCGKGQSEGEFLHHPVYIGDKTGPSDVDESSDAYDTIEWLLANIPGHNGRVGEWGIRTVAGRLPKA